MQQATIPPTTGSFTYLCFVANETKFMNASARVEKAVLKDVPSHINDGEILNFLYTKDINWQHVNAIKTLTDFNDEVISDWLNVSVKTFREYKKPQNVFKDNVKEQILLLLSLVKHGLNVLGSARALDQWLTQPNFYFDNRMPNTYLNTVTGIRFVDDRLTAMEYGDNV